jgi:hypothetical protein
MAVLGTTTGIHINHPQTTVDINVPELKLRDLFAQPEGAATTELVLRDVTAESPPGVLFDVYIAKKDAPNERKVAGTISWFGAFRHHGSTGPYKKTLRFDVTDQLRELGGTANTSGLTVTIEATQGRVAARPSMTPGMQADAANAFRPQAELQIGAIELRQATASPVP